MIPDLDTGWQNQQTARVPFSSLQGLSVLLSEESMCRLQQVEMGIRECCLFVACMCHKPFFCRTVLSVQEPGMMIALNTEA